MCYMGGGGGGGGGGGVLCVIFDHVLVDLQ